MVRGGRADDIGVDDKPPPRVIVACSTWGESAIQHCTRVVCSIVLKAGDFWFGGAAAQLGPPRWLPGKGAAQLGRRLQFGHFTVPESI